MGRGSDNRSVQHTGPEQLEPVLQSLRRIILLAGQGQIPVVLDSLSNFRRQYSFT